MRKYLGWVLGGIVVVVSAVILWPDGEPQPYLAESTQRSHKLKTMESDAKYYKTKPFHCPKCTALRDEAQAAKDAAPKANTKVAKTGKGVKE